MPIFVGLFFPCFTFAAIDPDEPPRAVDDAVETDEDEAVTFNVLSNDSDPDNDPLRVVDYTDPSHGDLDYLGAGRFTYTPDENFDGDDSFSYTISDEPSDNPDSRIYDDPNTDDATVRIDVDEDGGSNGGGGGSGSPSPSWEDMEIPSIPQFYTFSRDLAIGSTGLDVQNLQKYLNHTGFSVAASGFGSPGYETTYFGTATQSALMRFQSRYGITSHGRFDSTTRAKIRALQDAEILDIIEDLLLIIEAIQEELED